MTALTSPSAPYPTLQRPTYLEYDDYFRDLSREFEVHLIGNIVNERPYARSQISYPGQLVTLSPLWRNSISVMGMINKIVRKAVDTLDWLYDKMLQRFCSSQIIKIHPDILYSFPLQFERFPLYVAKKCNVPLVIEMWEDYAQFALENMRSLGIPSRSLTHWVNRIYRWMVNIAQEADRVIVPSTVFSKRLQKAGIPKRKIRLIPVCVKPNRGTDLKIAAWLESIKPNKTIVFHIGSSSPWHDLETLLSSLKHARSELLVIISGGTPKHISLTQKLKKVQIVITGKVTQAELSTYLTFADVCLAPYRFHQPSGFFPAKVIRYMLAGKGIIATDLPEIREMFKGRPAGLLVPAGNPLALAEAIDYLATNIVERQHMGATAKQIAQKNYLVKHHTQKLAHVYEELI